MQKWVALLRGVNVGGKNKLPMVELKTYLSALGLRDIKTYIQSGNVIFYSDESNASILSRIIADLVLDKFGFTPKIIVLTIDELQVTIDNCPFMVSEDEGNLLHYFFLQQDPANPNIQELNAIALPSERWQIKNSAFYLYTPDGFGRSKLAIKAEKLLGVATTARNWRTISKIIKL